MQYKLFNKPTESSALKQILINRGIPKEKIQDYITADESCVNPPEAFGEELMTKAAKMLIGHIQRNEKAAIVVDPDVDGNTSSALLLNYLYDLFPSWVNSNIDIIFHTGKQHGLNDCYENIMANKDTKLVLCPDGGSNDVEACKKLVDNGIEVLILDHHEYDNKVEINKYAVIVNNQSPYTNYPNKNFSGVGIVWQFCRFIDKLLHTSFADKYRDLVAIGNCGDMMSLTEIETSYLVRSGLKNLTNPFLYYMAEKNRFKLGNDITPIGAAFYIVPLLNAVQRSGTQEEKELVFKSMLTFHAFQEIPSTKRGHKVGEMETIVTQAVRVAGNVKNRQTRVQTDALDALEAQIEDQNLLQHKVLLILLESDNIPAEVRGLIANKFMAKYQRPCCLLTKGNGVYAGSARGCSLAGIQDFKQLCVNTNEVEDAVGHANAFGLTIKEENVNNFIQKTDELLKDMSDEAIYYVDYIFNSSNIDVAKLDEISYMDSYWGSGIDESLIALEGIKVAADDVQIYRKTSNTVKISLSCRIALMLFQASDEFCDMIKDNNKGYVEFNFVCKVNRNEFNGDVTTQLFIEDYEITDTSKYYF